MSIKDIQLPSRCKYWMRIVNESVALKGPQELLAYAITVAESYDSAPVHQPFAERYWHALKEHTTKVLFKQLGKVIKIELSADDPYSRPGEDIGMAIRRMLYDMLANRRLKIYTGHIDHPVFSYKENVMFRTVHDYYTHAKLLRPFRDGLKKLLNNSKEPSEDELRELLPKIDLSKGGNIGHRFGLRGEMNAYLTHVNLAPPEATAALFTEIIGQVAYETVVGDFPEQKVAVLGGFDYKHVGRFKQGSYTEKRFHQILEHIKAGEVEIATYLHAMPRVNVEQTLKRVNR